MKEQKENIILKHTEGFAMWRWAKNYTMLPFGACIQIQVALYFLRWGGKNHYSAEGQIRSFTGNSYRVTYTL